MKFGTNLEKIESVILRPAPNFTIKNVVTFGKRHYKTGVRQDALWESTYKSQKYSNVNDVGEIKIETSDYLVFSSRYEKKLIEIYMSYKHMKKVRDAFNEALEVASNNVEHEETGKLPFLETDDGKLYIGQEWEDWYISIPKLVGNKSINIMLELAETEDIDGTILYEPAVEIMFNNEEAFEVVTVEDLEGICYFLDNFDLLQSSQNLYLMAYLNSMSHSMNLEDATYHKQSSLVTPSEVGREASKEEKRKITVAKRRQPVGVKKKTPIIKPQEELEKADDGFMISDEYEEIPFL
jgi:hypothetical protein